VTFVNPIAPRGYHYGHATAIEHDLGYAFEFFLRIRPSLHSHGGHEHAEHVAGMEK
jgi:hypothetical protein